MTAELAIRTGLPGVLRENAYILPPDLTFNEWSAVLRLAEHIAEASPWWLADAMAYGEDRFAEEHSQALPTAEEDPHGVSQARMKQAGWMARKFPPVTRVPGATYTHHRVVADMLPGDRAYLLSVAVSEKLSTRDLIDRANGIKEERRGRAVSAEGEAICAADADDEGLAMPTRADLTDEALAALTYRLSGMGARHRLGFEAGWLQALVWNGAEDCFKERPGP